MTNIEINPYKNEGKIKPMHGIGQPPLMGVGTQYFPYLSDANIPFSRLHDVGGRFGGGIFVDIPNIFRNFDADVNDPDSYDFAFTDILIKGLIENNCQPVYRLGVTIENDHNVKAYHIYPPKDMKKWAEICEHIIRHYNEGWANGFHYGIVYWEIWNEPDNGRLEFNENAMWLGTAEEFYQLYRVTSKHLRECFGNTIKIGGYGHSGFYRVDDVENIAETLALGMALKEPVTEWEGRTQYFIDFFNGFLDMVIKEKLPFDFFSHHSYGNVETTVRRQIYAEKCLEEAGLGNVEIHLNEWNPNPRLDERGTLLACANATAMMIAMQYKKMDMMCYYDGRIGPSVYGGLFDPKTHAPMHTYFGFKAFGELYSLKNQVKCTCCEKDIFALAAHNGELGKALIVNNKNTAEEIKLEGITCKEAYIISENVYLEKIEISNNCYQAKPYETLLIVF